jgi:hypothetical protein
MGKAYIGRLEGSLKYGYSVILSCNIVETFWATGGILSIASRQSIIEKLLFLNPWLEVGMFFWSFLL